MCKIICVTNRKLVSSDFLTQMKKVVATHPYAVILREKDLSETDYETLAKEVNKICEKENVPLILHKYVDVAKRLGIRKIHLPLAELEKKSLSELAFFQEIGCSTHSVEQLKKAERLGATYVSAGHVFATDCKKGLPPRGMEFLKEMCQNAKIPVYAIGGMTKTRVEECVQAGAAGGLIMSGFMRKDS